VWSQFFLDSKGVDYLIKPTYFGISLMALFGFDLLVRVKVDDMYPRVSAFFKEAYKCVPGTFFIFVIVQAVLERFVIKIWNVQMNGTLVSIVGVTVLLWIVTFMVSMAVVWTVKKGMGIIRFPR
ncbi:MAG: sugar ABC transporter ATP-binding protein, partial [Lachnospiraceae bacterium]|nr:sugar ABC transporter ATP-binding protein [Lachnospiraceae bacterium]